MPEFPPFELIIVDNIFSDMDGTAIAPRAPTTM